MALKSFSHTNNSPQPGAKLGESPQACEGRLEANGATANSLLSPHRETTQQSFDTKCHFLNGWFCKICDRVTEHKEVEGREVCLECGYKMGQDVKVKKREYRQRPDVKAKKREYRQRPDVKAKKREYSQRPDVKVKKREYSQRPDVKAKQREYFQRPDVKAKQREYRQRPDVKAKKREHLRRRRIEKLEAKLQALKMEASQ